MRHCGSIAGGRFTIRHSTVTGSSATLASDLPDQVDGVGIDQVAIGGGLQLTEQVPATLIDQSTVRDNQHCPEPTRIPRTQAHRGRSKPEQIAPCPGLHTRTPEAFRIR